MTSDKYSAILTKIGLESNKWIRPSEINYIITESQSNHFYSPLNQKIYFDTTNDLIKIKYSELKPITSVLSKFSFNPNTNTLYFDNGASSIYSRAKMREPIAGDHIYACTKTDTGVTYVISEIKTVSKSEFGNYKIDLNDSNIITAIQAATTGMVFFVMCKGYAYNSTNVLKIDNYLEYYTEREVTGFPYDIAIGIDCVSGFQFSKE